MALVGHETKIYRRYAIQDEVMLQEGAARLDAYAVRRWRRRRRNNGGSSGASGRSGAHE
jgi:hypothetical protein